MAAPARPATHYGLSKPAAENRTRRPLPSSNTFCSSEKNWVIGHTGSVVAYHRWLESGESQDWRESGILKEIRDYNEVDCVSTWKLAEWLRNVQSESGLRYIVPDGGDKKESGDTGETVHPATALAERLISEVESGTIEDDESRHVQQLQAWLLEFHWREAKPVFWRMFDWHEKTEQELIDDFDCLGN